MKKIILLFVLIVCLGMASCTKAEVQGSRQEKVSMFVELEESFEWRVVYHRDTKVMYVVSLEPYNTGNFTVLVNQDGTPMLYEGDE